MALILVRHTRPDVIAGTCYGQLDLDVADTFTDEAQSVLERLKQQAASGPEHEIDSRTSPPPIPEIGRMDSRASPPLLPEVGRIVSSPLRRCLQLARFLAAACDLPLEVDDRLMEMDFGEWEGQPWSTVPASDLDDWADDFMHARSHGGESIAMLRERVSAALGEWSSAHRSTVIVTHAGVMKAASIVKDYDPWNFEPPVDFGGIMVLDDAPPAPEKAP